MLTRFISRNVLLDTFVDVVNSWKVKECRYAAVCSKYTYTHITCSTYSVKPFHLRKYSTLPLKTRRRIIFSTRNSWTIAVSSGFLCLTVCFFLILQHNNQDAVKHQLLVHVEQWQHITRQHAIPRTIERNMAGEKGALCPPLPLRPSSSHCSTCCSIQEEK